MKSTMWGRVARHVIGLTAAGLALVLAAATVSAQSATIARPLQVYFVDVEGGQATLFVTPVGESMLIDTGWPGNGGRDAGRIAAAAHRAGVKKIDYVLITHYHMDHVGGIAQLAARMPIGAVIDHGENREHGDSVTERMWQGYLRFLAASKVKRITPKPGDVLPLRGLDATVLSAGGAVIETPLLGGGAANATCATSGAPPADQTENARSLGVMLTFGKLRILDLGDLTSDKERALMCPVNKLGPVDVFVVSHHGWIQSNSAALVNGIASRVAIMDNGAAKGGSPPVWDRITKASGLEDLWQLHWSNEGGAAHNVAESRIANVSGPDAGNYLKLTAWPDGHFEIFNSRTQQMKRYSAR